MPPPVERLRGHGLDAVADPCADVAQLVDVVGLDLVLDLLGRQRDRELHRRQELRVEEAPLLGGRAGLRLVAVECRGVLRERLHELGEALARSRPVLLLRPDDRLGDGPRGALGGRGPHGWGLLLLLEDALEEPLHALEEAAPAAGGLRTTLGFGLRLGLGGLGRLGEAFSHPFDGLDALGDALLSRRAVAGDFLSCLLFELGLLLAVVPGRLVLDLGAHLLAHLLAPGEDVLGHVLEEVDLVTPHLKLLAGMGPRRDGRRRFLARRDLLALLGVVLAPQPLPYPIRARAAVDLRLHPLLRFSRQDHGRLRAPRRLLLHCVHTIADRIGRRNQRAESPPSTIHSAAPARSGKRHVGRAGKAPSSTPAPVATPIAGSPALWAICMSPLRSPTTRLRQAGRP